MLNDKPSPVLDAPIPGQGMTAPLGGRPWQQPPRYNTPEKALSFYVNRISGDKEVEKLLDLIELGVPVDTLVDSLQLGGVMEGLHSVDTGILIAPALMETVNQIGLKAGLKPVMPNEEDDPKKSSDAEIALQLKKLELIRLLSEQMLKRKRIGREIRFRGSKSGIRPIYNSEYKVNLFELLKTYSTIIMTKEKTVVIMLKS